MNFSPDKLSKFRTIQLEEMNLVKLLNRKDTKFIFHSSKVDYLLERLSSTYKLLHVDGINTFTYQNTYFDTEDNLFYNQHHNEKRNRYKVRFRQYSGTDDCYFEIKTKNNKNRTIKKRLKVEENTEELGDNEARMVEDVINISSQLLSPKLKVNFTRLTFVDKHHKERLTIDTNLFVKNGVMDKLFDQLMIAEIKQNKYKANSEFIQIVRDMKIPEMRFSKYCMGMLHVNDDMKYNRFKPKLLYINKLLQLEQN